LIRSAGGKVTVQYWQADTHQDNLGVEGDGQIHGFEPVTGRANLVAQDVEHQGQAVRRVLHQMGHPLCGTNASLNRIHFHRYWTDVRSRLVWVSEVSAALDAPTGLPIFCHK